MTTAKNSFGAAKPASKVVFNFQRLLGTCVTCLILLALAGCSGTSSSKNGGGGGGDTLSASPSTLTFANSTPQTFDVSGGSGTVSYSTTCSGIATLSGPQGNEGTWTVTPSATTGTCEASFSDTNGGTAAVTINLNLGPPPLTATPATLTFTSSTQLTFSVTGGTGTITDSNNCSGVATVTAPAAGVDGTWTVTPLANGSCVVKFTDSSNKTATVTITVSISDGLSVNPTSLDFTSSGAQTFVLSGGSGTITPSNNCSGVATVTPPVGSVDGTWTVTPVANGSCTANFVDSTSTTASVSISVSLSNSTLTWQMELDSSCATALDLKFFDETANLVWPSATQVYVLNQPGQAVQFPLSCTTGDKICYGASLYSNSDSPYYWGVGILNDQSCTDCCISCTTTTVTTVDLSGSGCAVVKNSHSPFARLGKSESLGPSELSGR